MDKDFFKALGFTLLLTFLVLTAVPLMIVYLDWVAKILRIKF